MDKCFRRTGRGSRPHFIAAGSILLSGIAIGGWMTIAQTASPQTHANSESSVLDGFRHVEASSVSDAVGIVPSTSVNHYYFAGSNIPIVCDGVTVHPHDVIVADEDGVVVVPRAQAAVVLQLAQKMDFQEHSMYPYIEKYKSIEEAVRKFGRL